MTHRVLRAGASVSVVGFVGLLLAAPALIVVPMSFTESPLLEFPPEGFTTTWYSGFFSDPAWMDAARNSLFVALLTTALATVLGTMAALALVRGRLRVGLAFNALLLSPAIVPIVVIAIGMYFVYSKWGLVGTMHGLVLAHATLALPFVVVSVMASVRMLDPACETAARSLGANPLRTFWHVTLPLILPGVLAGAIFAFVISWDDVVIAIFLTDPVFHTLPVEMWNQIRLESDPTIAAVSSLLVAINLVALCLFGLVRRLSSTQRSA